MPFQKGQSGNPSGRPKTVLADGRSLRDLAREHTETAILCLVEVIQEGESESARVGAATALLDRGWGKPTQAVEMSGPDGTAIQIEEKAKEDAEFVTRTVAGLAARLRETSVAGSTQH